MGTTDASEDVSYDIAMKQLHELFFANMAPSGLIDDPIALRKTMGYSDRNYSYPMRSLADHEVRWIDGDLYVVFDPDGARIEYPMGSPANDVPDSTPSLAGLNGSYPGHHPGFVGW